MTPWPPVKRVVCAKAKSLTIPTGVSRRWPSLRSGLLSLPHLPPIAVKNYKALSTYTDAHTDAWLMNACRNRLTTALRTYYRRKSWHAYSLNENISLPTGQIVGIMHEFFDQLHNHECAERIVAALNERERRIVGMRFQENMSFKEIAEQEHSTVAAIKAVLARLFMKIRKMASKNHCKFFTFTVLTLFFIRFIG